MSLPILVVVESEAKASTLEALLGAGYRVFSTGGILLDLPKSRLGVAVEAGFEAELITVRGRGPVIKELRKAAAKAAKAVLAMDDDREGEALAAQVAGLLSQTCPDLPVERVSLRALEPEALGVALAAPRPLDRGLVAAQEARRVLDRLVGYRLSPILWRSVKGKLSAGRVQSAVLRLVCDREDLVELQVPHIGWTLAVEARTGRMALAGELEVPAAPAEGGSATGDLDRAGAEALATALQGRRLAVREVWKTEARLEPGPPLTTSALIAAASEDLGFSPRKTMQVAAQLYEGLEAPGGRRGLITFPWTDSTRVSPEALEAARSFLALRLPGALPDLPRLYRPGQASVDLHEAIRPLDPRLEPSALGPGATRDQVRLYTLVWETFLASQLSPARIRRSVASALAGESLFRLASVRIAEPGFLGLLPPRRARLRVAETGLPEPRPGDDLEVLGLRAEARLDEGPRRFTEAGLVRALEDKGLGRPSTYAPVLSALVDRGYVDREGGELRPTALGRRCNEVLAGAFPEYLDPAFTAQMESRLDEVETGRSEGRAVVAAFYRAFRRRADEVEAGLPATAAAIAEPSGETCPACGAPLLRRLGRHGWFLACSAFPACTQTLSLPLGPCPRCGTGRVVERRAAPGRGRAFYACDRYPECDFFTYYRPATGTCPACGGLLVEKRTKRLGAFKACVNPGCTALHLEGDLDGLAAPAEALRG